MLLCHALNNAASQMYVVTALNNVASQLYNFL